MLAKMGWQAGIGLGVAGEGIVTPIESKLRPQKMGIAFKGFKEKTDQSKMEAKRRGEEVTGDEDDKVKKFNRKAKEQAEKRSDVWKRPKKSKVKIEHKTYEQIIAEAEEVVAPGIGQIIDATGAVVSVSSSSPVASKLTIVLFKPREVTSLADISLNTWTPSNDPTRIPEVRHNVRLIADDCKSVLDGLAREAKTLQERDKFVTEEEVRLRKKVDDEAQRKLFLTSDFNLLILFFVVIARLQQVQLLVNDINVMAKELTSVYEVSLEPFSPHFQKLISEYSYEYDKYRLDEIVVAAIAPIVRRMVANWDPLEQPSSFLPTFRSWQRTLKINDAEIPSQTQVDVYGTKSIVAPAIAM
jgi:tuftelin-interacting protein 11